MANEEMSVKDPVGNLVVLSGRTPPAGTENNFVNAEELSTVIARPAMLIEVLQDHVRFLYYFRSIDWHQTMLVEVREAGGQLSIHGVRHNPGSEEISALLKKGRQLV